MGCLGFLVFYEFLKSLSKEIRSLLMVVRLDIS